MLTQSKNLSIGGWDGGEESPKAINPTEDWTTSKM